MKLLLALAAVLLLAGCGGDNGADEPVSERPGLASVYEEIETMSCPDLQETFERNMSRYELRDPLARQQQGSPGEAEFAYAQAAQEQIERRC